MNESRRFGRYETRRVLGRGGMGTVWEAEDPLIGRTVAIKEIRLDTVADEDERRQLETRFELEFRAAGRLSHPNIVTLYDVGHEDDSTFIAMEYVAGRSLGALLKERPHLGTARVLELATQIAAGLDYAHDHDIVHRDVKPGNVLLTADGRPKITDFGLVKLMTAERTSTGTLMGTPAFMSPEQVMGRPVDRRSDQFSFAVVLYLMLTGETPFRAEHPSAVLYKIVHQEPAPPSRPGRRLPPAVARVVLRGLAKNPAERYGTCGELVTELATALDSVDDPLPAARALEDPTTVSTTADSVVDPTLRAGRPTSPPQPRHRGRGLGPLPPWLTPHRLGVAALVLVAGLASYFLAGGGGETATRSASARDAGDPASNEVTANEEGGTPNEEGGTPNGSADGAAGVSANAEDGTSNPSPNPLSNPSSIGVSTGGDGTAPVAPEPLELRITSRPPGAAIFLDGDDTGRTTPAPLTFEPGRRYALTLRLDGYDGAGWSFALDDLDERQRQRRRLHFPLRSSVPPGVVVVEADYPVAVAVGGRRWPPDRRHELDLAPGRRTVELVADEVFLRQTWALEVESGERQTLRAPAAVPVRIAANPANCRVSIDGRFVDVTPINDRMLAVGLHRFEFHWPVENRRRRLDVTINRSGQRIFATPDD